MFSKLVPVVCGKLSKVMKAEQACRRGNCPYSARFEQTPNRVQAKSLVVHHRPQAVLLFERQPKVAVTDAQFQAKVDRPDRVFEMGTHVLLGPAEHQCPGCQGQLYLRLSRLEDRVNN